MAAAGRVVTGFSKPYVAKYNVSGSTVTYSDGMKLARGVDVSIEPEVGDSKRQILRYHGLKEHCGAGPVCGKGLGQSVLCG